MNPALTGSSVGVTAVTFTGPMRTGPRQRPGPR